MAGASPADGARGACHPSGEVLTRQNVFKTIYKNDKKYRYSKNGLRRQMCFIDVAIRVVARDYDAQRKLHNFAPPPNEVLCQPAVPHEACAPGAWDRLSCHSYDTRQH